MNLAFDGMRLTGNRICYNKPMISKSSNFSLDDCTIKALDKNNLNSFATLCITADPLIKEGQQRRINFLHRKMAQNLWGYIAYDGGGNVAGFVDALPIEFAPQGVQGEDIYVIQCIAVRDDMQGKGLGRELIRQAVERSRDRAGLAIIAYDDPIIKPAAFFTHIGFAELEQNEPVRLLWLADKPVLPPRLSWQRSREKGANYNDSTGNGIRIELVMNDYCPYSYRMGRIVTQLLAQNPKAAQITIRRPEEKPVWRRLDIFPNLYINDQLKSIMALNEEETRALLDQIIAKPVEDTAVNSTGKERGKNPKRRQEKAR